MAKTKSTSSYSVSFPVAYANAIADAANRWAALELDIHQSIWALAGIPPAIGACMTSQMYSFPSKLDSLISLLKLRRADKNIIREAYKFASSFRDALDARNRIVHDVWMNTWPNFDPQLMVKITITAPKSLKYSLENVYLDSLGRDIDTIEARRAQAENLFQMIIAALPSLPEIPQTELHPIIEIRRSP